MILNKKQPPKLKVMKKVIFTLLSCAFILFCNAQKNPPAIKDTIVTKDTTTNPTKKDTTKPKNVSEDNNYGWKDKFALFVGGGIGTTIGVLYNDPVVNPTNNIVAIESSKKLRTSLTLGIVFTPKIYEVFRKVYISDKQGKKIDTATLIEHIPRKWSFALFLNPISLTKLNDNGFTNSVDLGFGIGWREGDFLFMATADFFSIRQPRQYFIDQFKDQNKIYIVNGQTQSTIDVTNNNIFHNVLVPSIGIKMCYAFNLTKSFYSNAQQLTK